MRPPPAVQEASIEVDSQLRRGDRRPVVDVRAGAGEVLARASRRRGPPAAAGWPGLCRGVGGAPRGPGRLPRRPAGAAHVALLRRSCSPSRTPVFSMSTPGRTSATNAGTTTPPADLQLAAFDEFRQREFASHVVQSGARVRINTAARSCQFRGTCSVARFSVAYVTCGVKPAFAAARACHDPARGRHDAPVVPGETEIIPRCSAPRVAVRDVRVAVAQLWRISAISRHHAGAAHRGAFSRPRSQGPRRRGRAVPPRARSRRHGGLALRRGTRSFRRFRGGAGSGPLARHPLSRAAPGAPAAGRAFRA